MNTEHESPILPTSDTEQASYDNDNDAPSPTDDSDLPFALEYTKTRSVNAVQQVAQAKTISSSQQGQSSQSLQIDQTFIHKNEGFRSDMYVPVDKSGNPIGQSGATIGYGVDLGQMNSFELDKMVRNAGLSVSIANKIKPYLGKKGVSALNFVRANPLSLSQTEINALQRAKQNDLFTKLVQTYDRARKQSGNNTKAFAHLPPAVQTVVSSVAFQYGPRLDVKAKKFLRHVVDQNWSAVLQELRNFGDNTPTRRKREAAYLEHHLRQSGLLKP